MEIVLFWLFFSIIAGAIASSKGRSGFGFFLLAVLLSPLIGIICALVAGPNTEKLERTQVDEGSMRRCPDCAELIRIEAVKCKHCGSDIGPAARNEALHPLPSAESYGFGYWLGSLFRRKG